MMSEDGGGGGDGASSSGRVKDEALSEEERVELQELVDDYTNHLKSKGRGRQVSEASRSQAQGLSSITVVL